VEEEEEGNGKEGEVEEKWVTRRTPPKFKIQLQNYVAHGHMVRHRKKSIFNFCMIFF
jgi:hypothetical protein